jgi:large subunit ribosomal protein L4
VKEGAVVVVDQIALADGKTRSMVAFLRSLGADKGALVVVHDLARELALAGRNLQNVQVMKSSAVNAYHMLLYKKVVFSREGLTAFVQRLSRQEVEA